MLKLTGQDRDGGLWATELNKTSFGKVQLKEKNQYFWVQVTFFETKVLELVRNKKQCKKNHVRVYDYGARFYDATLGRFSTQDAYAEKYHFMSPYQYGANNPIKFIDVNGDSTAYFSSSGKYLFTINDKAENGITVIASRKLLNFWTEFAELLNNGKVMESTDILRGFGDTYMANDMWAFNDANNDVPDDEQKALTKEFGTCLYQNNKGEIRTGKEIIEGDWETVWNTNIGGEGSKNPNEKHVSNAHLHTNTGKFTPKGGGLPSPNDPQDYKSAPGPDDRYWNAVISNKEIQLYKTLRVDRGNANYYYIHTAIRIQRYPFKGLK